MSDAPVFYAYGSIKGWRVWKVIKRSDRYFLASLNLHGLSRKIWEKPLPAECCDGNLTGYRWEIENWRPKLVPHHSVPDFDCTCGFYSWKRLISALEVLLEFWGEHLIIPDIGKVLARLISATWVYPVLGIGLVANDVLAIDCTKGFRARISWPLAVWIPTWPGAPHQWDKIFSDLRAHYQGIPVDHFSIPPPHKLSPKDLKEMEEKMLLAAVMAGVL